MSTSDEMMTPAEVAALFRVDPKTVTRWARSGRFGPDVVKQTLGGHRRYRRSVVMRLFNGEGR